MDREELIFQEYKLYAEQKENFIDRNFRTNRFYMVSFVAIIFAMIFTGEIVFINHISATLVFSLIGISVCSLWWMNVDNYNILIKIKFNNVLESIEEKLPVKPFQDEYKGIEEFRNNKVFMFSDIQKFIAACGALFFFAVLVTELSPIAIKLYGKIVEVLGIVKGGI
jgi:hypothetical protein